MVELDLRLCPQLKEVEGCDGRRILTAPGVERDDYDGEDIYGDNYDNDD